MFLPVVIKRLVFIFFLILNISRPLFSQYNEQDFIRHTVKQGLTDNYVTSIQQDEWGYIWVATDAGLNRFDGNSFKTFYQQSSLDLASNTVFRLKMLGKSKLGILGSGGLQVLDTKNNLLRNYFVPDSTAFTVYRNNTWDAISKNNSYFLTTTTGFYEFNEEGTIVFRYDAHQPGDVNNQTVRYGRDIFEPTDNIQVVYTRENGTAIFDNIKKTFNQLPAGERNWFPFTHPVDEKSSYWVCKTQLNENEFLFFYNNKDSVVYYNHPLKQIVVSPLPPGTTGSMDWESKVIKVSEEIYAVNCDVNGFAMFRLEKNGQVHWNPRRMLPTYHINCLFVDKDQRLWAGTPLGLLQQKLNPSFLQTRHYRDANEDSVSGWFTSTLRYKDKTYIGRYARNYGLLITDTGLSAAVKKITFYGNGNAYNEVRSVQCYHPDTLWLGTSAGFLWFDTRSERYGKLEDQKKYPELKGFTAIMAAPRPDGTAWMCSYMNGIVARYDIAAGTFRFFTSQSNPALPFRRVKSIVYDAYGDVWISGHGLTRWNNRKQIFDTVIMEYSGVNKFYEDILTISADNYGSLWLHNARNGLLEYQIDKKKFVAYTINDGLPSSEIRALSPVVNGKLWIGCNNQLALFDTRTKRTMLFDESDGLPESRPTSRFIDYDAAGQRYFLACNDFVLFFPHYLPATRNSTGKLLIQELVVNNKTHFFNPGNNLLLNPAENNLALHFSLIDFEGGDNYKFAYKLNQDEEWTNIDEQRMINLTGLAPGDYSIALKATGKSGDQHLETFLFSIAPPFWKKAWFFICGGLLLTALGYLVYRYRIRNIRQKANLDKLLAQTEMKALHAQMNPHFIFNSLNSISEMILNNENKDASHYLSKFAHLIRITLDQSGKGFVSLANTMDYLQRYIEMEQIRNSHFKFSMTAAGDLEPGEILLPPMLIQPFIENAIWHGITEERKNITIQVEFKKEENQLICIIEDNGIGIKRSLDETTITGRTHHPVGIANIRNRIALLNEKHDLQCSVDIKDKTEISGISGPGTIVRLRLPLEIKEV